MAEDNKKKEVVTFISKFRGLKLIRESAYTREVNGKFLPQKGKYCQFKDGVFSTDDKDEIKFLEDHKNFGTHFIKVDKSVGSERAEYVQTLEERNAVLEAKLSEKEDEGNKVIKELPKTVPELKALANEKGIDISGLKKKADIEKAIEKGLETAEF